MRKMVPAILGVVAVLVIASVYLVPAIQWDGSAVRQVKVIVQTGGGTPILGSEVTFRDRDYDWWVAWMARSNAVDRLTEEEMRNCLMQGLRYSSGSTDAEGSFTFSGVFPAGGTRFLFWDNGRFRPEGAILIQAEGYRTVDRSLSELVGQSSVSLREYRQKPLVVRCVLERAVPRAE